MTRSFRTATTGLAVALMLTGITVSAHGFMGLSPWQTGIPGRLIQLRGTVVCTGCTLAEARRLWVRYLDLDAESEWGRIARKGIQFVDLHVARTAG